MYILVNITIYKYMNIDDVYQDLQDHTGYS